MELILRTAEDRELTIPIKEIEEQAMGGSLMPDGLTDTLTRGELLDLVRFLSELGKVGPWSVARPGWCARWQALEDSPSARALLNQGIEASVKDNPALLWGPAYSTVPAGVLPWRAASSRQGRTPSGLRGFSAGRDHAGAGPAERNPGFTARSVAVAEPENRAGAGDGDAGPAGRAARSRSGLTWR